LADSACGIDVLSPSFLFLTEEGEGMYKNRSSADPSGARMVEKRIAIIGGNGPCRLEGIEDIEVGRG